jgi:hypothetical protein
MVWEERTFDLADSRDSTLIGTIGELVAWRYLRMTTGLFPMWFGAGQYLHPQYPLRRGENYEISGLDEAQIEFLKNAPRRYDFILVKRKRIAPGLLGEPEETYLVEVKTTFGRRRHDLEGGIEGMKRKLPEVEDIETAKRLGFHVLLIVVRLLDNWRCKVTCKEM